MKEIEPRGRGSVPEHYLFALCASVLLFQSSHLSHALFCKINNYLLAGLYLLRYLSIYFNRLSYHMHYFVKLKMKKKENLHTGLSVRNRKSF